MENIVDLATQVNLFFSWQSDKQNYATYIRRVINKAKKLLIPHSINLVLQEATKDEVGSNNIGNKIFEKIDSADFFVADISFTSYDDALDRYYPNSNVLFETGYAYARLKTSRVLLLFNKRSGPDKYIPFDFRNNQYSPFSVSEKPKDIEAIANRIVEMILDCKKNGSLKAGLVLTDAQKEEYRVFASAKYDLVQKYTVLNNLIEVYNTVYEDSFKKEFLKRILDEIEIALFDCDIINQTFRTSFKENSNMSLLVGKCEEYHYHARLFHTCALDVYKKSRRMGLITICNDNAVFKEYQNHYSYLIKDYPTLF